MPVSLSQSSPKNLNKIILILAVFWTAAILAIFLIDIKINKAQLMNEARAMALATFEKDVQYRRWNTNHGGVYVPVTKKTLPNPFLDVENRDITSQNGIALTLINPAYMTRQVHELSEEAYGIRGHITSLNPLRPQNAPDPWEINVLKLFEQGIKEYSSEEVLENQPYLRYMKPMVTEKLCLKCHEKQGYQEGEIRGGVSVSIPLKRYLLTHSEHVLFSAWIYALFWLAGLGVLFYISNNIIKQKKNREETAQALQTREQMLRLFIEHAPAAIAMFDKEMKYISCSNRWLMDYHLDGENIQGRSHYEIFPELTDDLKESHRRAMSGEVITKKADRFERIEGSDQWVNWEVRPWKDENGEIGGIILFTEDITDLRQAENEAGKLQAQLVQAQKLESVGRLAGGVAHDFNNMLSVIIGRTEMILEDTDPNQPLYEDLLEIKGAAQRSVDVTRQLLAFARKQTIAPKVIDLNKAIENILKMLRRLIGEDIELFWHPGYELWSIKMDPSQLDQILANLSINARDAITGTGNLTIETKNVTIDGSYCENHPDFSTGDFVQMTVSDNGCGMEKETLNNMFEPFFTTKDTDKGTGLGLATVYGIVKQNNGFINVYSEPNKGTSFKIYLPRHTAPGKETHVRNDKEAILQGNECILLVEDEASILKMTEQMLIRMGYTVLAANKPGEAINIANEHSGEIHLLLTDVVMPEMNGQELLKNLLQICPDLKSLFMSGYTANVIAHHGVLDEDIHYIQKPFSRQGLSIKLREVLGDTNR